MSAARQRAPRIARAAHRSQGQALIAALLLGAVLAAGALLADGQLRARAEAVAHARSLDALAQARSALIGYAISYAERHPGEGYGFLPCPDRGNDGSTPIGACGARDTAAIGRLPWRTLGLAELRDGWGECLWYAVSGSAKHNPKPLALNWDSPGQFALEDARAHRCRSRHPTAARSRSCSRPDAPAPGSCDRLHARSAAVAATPQATTCRTTSTIRSPPGPPGRSASCKARYGRKTTPRRTTC